MMANGFDKVNCESIFMRGFKGDSVSSLKSHCAFLIDRMDDGLIGNMQGC